MNVLTAAYSRMYKTEAEVVEAYLSGKDFMLNNISSQWHRSYCSIRDFPNETIELRYGSMNEHLTIMKGDVE